MFLISLFVLSLSLSVYLCLRACICQMQIHTQTADRPTYAVSYAAQIARLDLHKFFLLIEIALLLLSRAPV